MTQAEKQIHIYPSEAGGLHVIDFEGDFEPRTVLPGVVKALLDPSYPGTYTVRQGENPHQLQVWPHLSAASVTWLGDVFGVGQPMLE